MKKQFHRGRTKLTTTIKGHDKKQSWERSKINLQVLICFDAYAEAYAEVFFSPLPKSTSKHAKGTTHVGADGCAGGGQTDQRVESRHLRRSGPKGAKDVTHPTTQHGCSIFHEI